MKSPGREGTKPLQPVLTATQLAAPEATTPAPRAARMELLMRSMMALTLGFFNHFMVLYATMAMTTR